MPGFDSVKSHSPHSTSYSASTTLLFQPHCASPSGLSSGKTLRFNNFDANHFDSCSVSPVPIPMRQRIPEERKRVQQYDDKEKKERACTSSDRADDFTVYRHGRRGTALDDCLHRYGCVSQDRIDAGLHHGYLISIKTPVESSSSLLPSSPLLSSLSPPLVRPVSSLRFAISQLECPPSPGVTLGKL